MSNALNWAHAIRGQGKVFLPYGEGKVVMIHPRDVASVAARALTESGHENQAYPLTGAQALGAAELMAILSEAVGKPIAYVGVTDETASENMLKAGMPLVLVEGPCEDRERDPKRRGRDTIADAREAARPTALTWRDWAAENAAAFR